MKSYKMWIGGKWVGAESGKTYKVVNPATEEEIAEVSLGDKADVDKAVEAARKAFPVWSKKTQAERSRIINEISVALKERAREFTDIEVLDHGWPVSIARFLVMAAAGTLEYAANTSKTLKSDFIPLQNEAISYLQIEPIGVCALITSWNFPLNIFIQKLAPALAVGNTCIIKPASIDSLSALKFADIIEMMEKQGLPPGAVNIITGPGATVGEILSTHPGVDFVGLTGSTEAGKAIMSAASGTLKRIQLELGGKNPFIVMEDADLDLSVASAIYNATYNCGMVCASAGRYYINEKIHDEFVNRLIAGLQKVVVGNPNDEKTQMGPVVSAEHRDKIESYIKSGLKEGAKLVLGGKRPIKPPLDKGYYVMPTVFTNVTQNMKIAREEIFGPVVCVMKFSSDDEVIELANDTTYGLCASVWTKNLSRGVRFTREVRAGTVWINGHQCLYELPWGGFKGSGFGKEGNIMGLLEYTQVKAVGMFLS